MSLWRRLVTEAHRRSLWQVLGIYLVGSWIGYEVVLALVEGIGLPAWLPGFAVVLFIVGLPIVLATTFVQEGLPRQADAPLSLDPALFPDAQPQATEQNGRLTHVLTWRRALGAGVLAFAILGGLAAGWLALRALGIGPMASLLAAEELHENDRILIAEFDARGVDTTLASVVSDAFRIDFARSTVVRTVTAAELQSVLRRMGRSELPRIDAQLANEIAQRDGIPAYLTGEVSAAGSSYLLSARLMSTASGEVLVALREKASTEDDVIDAVDRLSRALRERTGESLKTIHRAQPLAQVTTASLAALQFYTQAGRASSWEGNPQRAAELLREALRHDSTFAGAYRGLGIFYTNAQEPDSAIAMLERALSYADRLGEAERENTRASYHMARTEYDEAIGALERLLSLEPRNTAALNNLALALGAMGEIERANEYYRRSVEADTSRFFGYANLGESYVLLGRYNEAEEAFRNAALRAPQSAWAVVALAQVPYAAGDIAEAERRVRSLIDDAGSTQAIRERAEFRLLALLRVQGRLDEGRRLTDALLVRRAWSPEETAWSELDRAMDLAFITGDERAGQQIARMQTAIADLVDADLLVNAALICGWSGDVSCASTYLARAGRPLRQWSPPVERIAYAGLAQAQGDFPQALRILRETRNANCHGCVLPWVGRIFLQLQQPDSAAAAWEQYLATPAMDRLFTDFEVPNMREALGGYYEQRGDRAKAAEHYARFVDLWKDADPALQPRVASARAQLERLQPDR